MVSEIQNAFCRWAAAAGVRLDDGDDDGDAEEEDDDDDDDDGGDDDDGDEDDEDEDVGCDDDTDDDRGYENDNDENENENWKNNRYDDGWLCKHLGVVGRTLLLPALSLGQGSATDHF